MEPMPGKDFLGSQHQIQDWPLVSEPIRARHMLTLSSFNITWTLSPRPSTLSHFLKVSGSTSQCLPVSEGPTCLLACDKQMGGGERRRVPGEQESCFPSAWVWLVYLGTAGPGSHHLHASHLSNAENRVASICQALVNISAC